MLWINKTITVDHKLERKTIYNNQVISRGSKESLYPVPKIIYKTSQEFVLYKTYTHCSIDDLHNTGTSYSMDIWTLSILQQGYCRNE